MAKQQLGVNDIAAHFVERLRLIKDHLSLKLTGKRYFMNGCWERTN
jgi:hypothetical protein